MDNNEVYILCMMFGNETEIFGVYFDKKELIKAYDKIAVEDSRCLGNFMPRRKMKPELPILYRLPMNCFIGRKVEWCSEQIFIFMDWIEEYEVDIREVRQRVPITEFYGITVYCDIDFENGPIYEVEYEMDNDCYHRIIDLDKGFQEDDFGKYVGSVIKAWYEDNKHFLQQIYEKRVLIAIPNWEE